MTTQDNFAVEDILVEQHYIPQEEMDQAKKAAPQGKVVEYLLQNKKLTPDLLGQALAEHYKILYFDLNSASIPKENLLSIPPNIAATLRFIIVNATEKTLDVTTDLPVNGPEIKETLAKYYPGKEIKFFFSLGSDIDEQFRVYRDTLQATIEKIIESNDINFAANLFSEIVEEALHIRASDIHLEPGQESVLLRMRIDGVLKEFAAIPKDYYDNLLNRIKVLAGIRLDEHYRAQDGAVRYSNDVERIIDLRVSIVPILDGQKVVIRVLADYVKNLGIDSLGLNKTDNELVNTAAKRTFGMILTTGPTGSGKTTSMYALLKSMHRPEFNITTIEDPVEYRIPGINQIQVNKDQDITFASGLRSIVRQDPNIILVGEIRDFETAEIAVNASLTGHLLLSTFHANDAATAVPRLLDMGVEPFLLASTLNLIIAQRLVRKTCESCRVSYEYKVPEIKELVPNYKEFKILNEGDHRFYRGKGCEQCAYTGFRGRVGIFELIYVTREIQDLILKRASSKDIWDLAQKQGAHSFFEDGLEKVSLGNVALEELVRVAPTQLNQANIYGPK